MSKDIHLKYSLQLHDINIDFKYLLEFDIKIIHKSEFYDNSNNNNNNNNDNNNDNIYIEIDINNIKII